MSDKFDTIFEKCMKEINKNYLKEAQTEEELKELAMAYAKKAFGDDVDESKVDDIVKNAIEKSTKDGKTDFKSASGIIFNSYN